MRFEVVREKGAIELRVTNDDKSITIWVCDTEETAFYKLASLLFSKPEPAKTAKRSILVGEFVEAAPERVDLEDVAKQAGEAAEKRGLKRKGDKSEEKSSPDLEKLLELIKQQKQLQEPDDSFYKTYPYKYGQPLIAPNILPPVIGTPMPNTIPSVQPWPYAGTADWPMIDVNVSGGVCSGGEPNFNEKKLGTFYSNGAVINTFMCSMSSES